MEQKIKDKVNSILDFQMTLPAMGEDQKWEETWNELYNLLVDNEEDTIKFIFEEDDKHLEWLAPSFEDLNNTWRSPYFIDQLNKLAEERPNIDISIDIEEAAEHLD
jgi:hypothetical protein